VIILALVFSFSSCVPPFLNYIQALTIPLFMSYPIFMTVSYDNATIWLTLAYFIVWVAILRVKFYGLLKPLTQRNSKRHYSHLVSAAFFIIVLVSSWLVFARFTIGQYRKGGLFREERPGEETGLEEEYYKLQDKIQGRQTG